MSSPTAYAFDRQRIVLADEASSTADMITDTLRRDGHCVVHTPGSLGADYSFSLAECHLLISSMRVDGMVRLDLLAKLRECLPALSILYLANAGQGTAELAAELPEGLSVLRAPFTAADLQAAVLPLLPRLRTGTVLALQVSAAQSSCPESAS